MAFFAKRKKKVLMTIFDKKDLVYYQECYLLSSNEWASYYFTISP